MVKFEKNTKGRDFVVGDIHGMFSKLTDDLLDLRFDFDNDRLFCTGDLVDRGPESHLALDWLAHPWFFSVRGNHEDMAIGYCYDLRTPGSQSDWIYSQNGGDWFINMLGPKRIPFAEAFKQLPLRIQIQDVGIVHAQAPLDWLKPDPEHIMLWSRNRISLKDAKGTANIGRVYLGHTPLKTRTVLGNNVYIDTGACFGKAFTIEEI